MPRKPKCEPWKNIVVIGQPSEEAILRAIRKVKKWMEEDAAKEGGK